MCVHNAQRDLHLFKPARIEKDGAPRWWNAATGTDVETAAAVIPDLTKAPLKRLKGRERAKALTNHPNRTRRMTNP
jgi:hypothetical protein